MEACEKSGPGRSCPPKIAGKNWDDGQDTLLKYLVLAMSATRLTEPSS